MNDLRKDVQKWYTDKYKNLSGSRYETFKLSLSLLYSYTDSPLILETGTVRQKDDFGAGYSTVIFGECVSKFGGNLISIDNNQTNIDLSIELTSEYNNKIQFICGDSIESLKKIKNEVSNIDLLYLDSFDCPIVGDATESQIHNLNEFKTIEDNLHYNTLVLIDDIAFENGGKGKLTHEYLLKNNYKLIIKEQQSLWIK